MFAWLSLNRAIDLSLSPPTPFRYGYHPDLNLSCHINDEYIVSALQHDHHNYETCISLILGRSLIDLSGSRPVRIRSVQVEAVSWE